MPQNRGIKNQVKGERMEVGVSTAAIKRFNRIEEFLGTKQALRQQLATQYSALQQAWTNFSSAITSFETELDKIENALRAADPDWIQFEAKMEGYER